MKKICQSSDMVGFSPSFAEGGIQGGGNKPLQPCPFGWKLLVHLPVSAGGG